MLTEIPKGDPGQFLFVIFEEARRRMRDENLPPVSHSTDSRRAMNRQADVPIDGQVRLSRMDAYPHPDGGSSGPRVRCDGLLARGGCEDGVLRAWKSDEERVALVVDLPAAVGSECFPEEAVVIGQDACVLAAMRPEELRRTYDVREQKRGRS